MERLKEISKARADNTPEVSGYVRNVGYNRFVLLPTLLTPQCYLYCICAKGVTLPRNNEYIRIFGRVRYSPSKRYSTINFKREVVVNDWIPDKPVFPEIDLSMTFRDFREDVFLKFLNVEPLVQDLIA
jgi:hypothetical protein